MAALGLQDVADGRATELVDRLIVIANHGHAPVRCGEQLHELRLGPVGVLKLVHEDVAVAPLQLQACRRRLAKQPQREADLIAEIDQPCLPKQRLIAIERPSQLALAARFFVESRDRLGCLRAGVRPGILPHPAGCGRRGQCPGEIQIRLRAHILVFAAAEERAQRTQKAGGIAQGTVFVQLELEEPLAQEDHDLRSRQDP